MHASPDDGPDADTATATDTDLDTTTATALPTMHEVEAMAARLDEVDAVLARMDGRRPESAGPDWPQPQP